MTRILSILLLLPFYASAQRAPSQTSSMPITVIDSASKLPLDSVKITLVKYGRKPGSKTQKVVEINKTGNLGEYPNYYIMKVEREGYEPLTKITDEYYKVERKGKSTSYYIEIPLRKSKKGVKLVPH
jgi:hypothetical protein